MGSASCSRVTRRASLVLVLSGLAVAESIVWGSESLKLASLELVLTESAVVVGRLTSAALVKG